MEITVMLLYAYLELWSLTFLWLPLLFDSAGTQYELFNLYGNTKGYCMLISLPKSARAIALPSTTAGGNNLE